MTGARITHHGQVRGRWGHCPIPSPLWEQEEACLSLRSSKKLVAEDAAAPPQSSWPSWRRKSVYVVKKAKLFHLIYWLHLYNSLYNKLCVGLKGRGKNYVCIITKLHIHRFLIQFQATADQKYSSGKKILGRLKKQNLNLLCAEHYARSMQMKWCVGIPCCSLYANIGDMQILHPFI